MSIWTELADKWREDATFRRRVVTAALAATAAGAGIYVVRRGGYRSGYYRGFGAAVEIMTDPQKLAYAQHEAELALEERERHE